MAFAAVVDHHNPNNPSPNHLHLDSLPLIDLRLLSQSDLHSLSLTSSSLPHPTRRFDDDVMIPKIDRSVFNESAGSRKQTYFRLRLAPRNSQLGQFSIPNAKSKSQTASHSHSQRQDPETLQIITLVKQLFPSETTTSQSDGALVSIPVRLEQNEAAPGPSSQNAPLGLSGSKRKRGRPRKDANVILVYAEVNVDDSIENRGGDDTIPGIVVQSSDGKRKRGRPRKVESRVVSMSENEKKASVKEARVNVEEAEMVMVNGNGVVVDLLALGNADDSFAEALRKRTEGMETEAQLLGFLGGLEGEWSSARKKRKIVLASELGDTLPRRWKILLSLKRNGGHVWLSCRRFISPNGQQFVSCKEVSSYLLSYFGVGNQSKLGRTDGDIQFSNKMVSGDGMQHDTNLTFDDESKANELVSCSLIPITSVSIGHEKQETFLHIENSLEIQAGEVIGMPKNFDPVKTGVLQTSLKIHESFQVDRETTLDSIANYDLSSDFPRAKVNKDVEKCFGTCNPESISLSCVEKTMKADKKGKDLGLAVQDSVFNLTNDELAKVDEVTGSGVHLVYQNALNNGKKDVCECSGETNVFNCFLNGINDGVKVYMSSVEFPKVGIDTALNGTENECGDDNIDNCRLTSSVEITKNDDVDDFGNGRSISGISKSCIGPEDVYTIVKQQSTSETCSLVPSVVVESVGERGLCSTSTDEKTLDISNFNRESFCTAYEAKFEGMDISGNDDKRISFESDHAMADGNDMEISEHVISTGSCLNVPAPDGQSCITLRNAKNPSYTVEELRQEKSFQSNVSTQFVKEDRGLTKTGMVCPSGYAHSYDIVNNVTSMSSSSMKELEEEEVKGSWNSGVLLAFDSSHAGICANSITSSVQERSSEGPSLVLSANDQTFSTGNNFTGVFSSSVLDRGSVNGLIHPNGSEQTPVIENNLNRVYSSVMWEQPNSETAEKSRNNEPMTGFLNHSQPSGDVVAELMWRINEENNQQSGLADTPSACHPNFNMLSGKGPDGVLSVNEKFDNVSGLEGQPGRIEQLEYNFQTTQASSHSKESKALSYDGETEQGFSSSAWLEKESLPSMPNIASRSEINICIWCRNEFYHLVYEAGKQTGSAGLMCSTCQAKFSGQFDYL